MDFWVFLIPKDRTDFSTPGAGENFASTRRGLYLGFKRVSSKTLKLLKIQILKNPISDHQALESETYQLDMFKIDGR